MTSRPEEWIGDGGMKGVEIGVGLKGFHIFVQPNLRNKETNRFHCATCSCILEAEEKLQHLRGFYPQLGFFADFFYVLIREERRSCNEWGLVRSVNQPKIWVRAPLGRVVRSKPTSDKYLLRCYIYIHRHIRRDSYIQQFYVLIVL